MGIVRKLAVGAGVLVGVVLVMGAGSYVWASRAAQQRLSVRYDVHRPDFPIPFPLTVAERDSLPKGTNGDSVALVRAVARGQHLVESFYPCGECHGSNLGGGVMVDDPGMGTLRGANLTMGKGSKTVAYTAADWDRMVRHGVKPDGTPSVMPAMDFFDLSDRELSDIVAYIRSLPAVDNTEPPVTLGPVGTVLVATGKVVLSAEIHPSKHEAAHAAEAPPALPDARFGQHLAQTCSGCHGANFAGGPIVGGPPDWPPARNITPSALAGWTYDDFLRAMREAKSKDGTALKPPMASMVNHTVKMTETELRALWAYLSTLPPRTSAN